MTVEQEGFTVERPGDIEHRVTDPEATVIKPDLELAAR